MESASPWPKKLFIGTSNQGKLREMIPLARELFGDDIEIEGRSPPLDEETGVTYVENAELKAHALDGALVKDGEKNYMVLTDDSGLSVDALDGRPGVHSARYAGDHVDPRLHIEKLIRELGAKTKAPAERTARYHCALTLIVRDARGQAKEISTEGTCEGLIGFENEGASGFGYDPIFIVPAYGKTFGQLSEAVKQGISHRKDAFDKLSIALESF